MSKRESADAGQSDAPVQLCVHNAVTDLQLYCLEPCRPLRIGRSSRNDVVVCGDRTISREHLCVSWDGCHVLVKCLSSARNPIVYGQQAVRQFRFSPGDMFLVGVTAFQIVACGHAPDRSRLDALLDCVGEDQAAEPVGDRRSDDTIRHQSRAEKTSQPPSLECVFASAELRQLNFREAARQLELLSALPGRIDSSRTDEELALQIAELLLEALPRAEAAAVVSVASDVLRELVCSRRAELIPRMMRVDTRGTAEGTFRPSRQLIAQALTERKNVLHVWGQGDAGSGQSFTQSMGLDWAFCVPLLSENSRGWCLYVSGRGGPRGAFDVTADDFQGELRFTELVAQFLGSVRQVRVLQDQKTQLSSFFSPKVIDSLMDSGGVPSLEPDARDVSVLFCDVRGFSLKAEVDEEDLPDVLRSGREALGVMARAILDFDGAIADFQGDAALGFWGWPVPLETGPLPACRAALQIVREFRRASRVDGGPLQGFGVGIGIAHGRALAGQIGTDNQAKIGVFGRIVNLGSRLEGMTKLFGVDICVDEATARCLQASRDELPVRIRRLARVIPKGMQTAETVYGLVPSLAERPQLTDALIDAHGHAVQAVIDGRWTDAMELLKQFPPDDLPARFLRRFLEDGRRTCPPDWTGAIPLRRK